VIKTYYTWKDLETAADAIMLGLLKDGWRPDCIVGVTRGGLPLALLLSHRMEIPMHTVKVQLRDGTANEDTETNLWLPEMAIGYVLEDERETLKCRWDIKKRRNILIVDDINDTGTTFEWIKKDWESSCFPNEQEMWKSVWGRNVRFAVMTQNCGSNFEPDYWWHEVDKREKNEWLVYPWEQDSWLRKDEK
jgi:hypoxanthine phosphoribosyltransferase